MTVADVAVTPVAGGIAAPAGFRAAGVVVRHQEDRPRPRAAGVGHGRVGGGRLHDQQGAGGARAGLQGHLASGRRTRRARSSSTAAAPTPAPARTAWTTARRDGRRGRRRAPGCDPSDVLVASTGVIGVTLDRATVVERHRRGGGGADARRRRARGARDHDDRSVSEGSGRRGRRRPAARFRVGGIAKGSGMIEPLMATMLGVVTTDAQVAPALLQRALTAVTDDDVQRDLRGRRVLDERLRVRAGQRRQRRRARARRTSPLLVEALRHVCEPLALGIVRGGEGATKLVTIDVTGARVERGGEAGGAGDRELAAREDRDARRRSELGPPGRRRRPRRRRLPSRSRARADRRRRAVRRRPAVRRARAARRPSTCRTRTSTLRVDLGTGGAGTARMWTCDLSAEYVRINAEYRT